MDKAKAFISVGHYPQKPGAVNNKFSLIEYHEAKKIVDTLFQSILTNGSHQLHDYVLVDSLALPEKVRFINQKANNSDIAVEIHFNAYQPNQAQGIETLYFPGSKKGKSLAASIQKALLEFLPFVDRGLKERDDLYLLKAATIPAIIAEVLFIDNDQEASYLFYPRSYLLMARALFQGIEGYFSQTTA